MRSLKQMLGLVIVGFTLSACAPTPSSTADNSRSNVEVYGEVDVGVGTQQIRN